MRMTKIRDFLNSTPTIILSLSKHVGTIRCLNTCFDKLSMIVGVIFFLLLTSCSSPQPYYQGPKSDHFNGINFTSEIKTLNSFDKIKSLFLIKKSWDEEEIYAKPKNHEFAEIKNARVTFIGQATLLIQTPQANILTDPTWSNDITRKNRPALDFDSLPKINYVLISSNFKYHMDIDTIKKLQEKFAPKFITGLGNCYLLNNVKNLGITCLELDWNQKITLQNELKFYFLKAKNYENKTLSGSFAIIAQNFKIYFGGDGGYGDHMRQIGLDYGPFDLALLSIGNYQPRWLFKEIHMNPEEAVKSHIVLQSKKSIAMNFNSFHIGNETYLEPLIDLEEAKIKYNLRKDEFVAPKFGESFEF